MRCMSDLFPRLPSPISLHFILRFKKRKRKKKVFFFQKAKERQFLSLSVSLSSLH